MSLLQLLVNRWWLLFAHAFIQVALSSLMTPVMYGQITVRTDLQIHDVYYSKSTDLLYVTTAANSADAPNSLLAIDPKTGQDLWRLDAGGADPGQIAGSDDGRYAYVCIQSAGLIVRFDLENRRADMNFPATMAGAPDNVMVSYMKVVQGDPDTLAVSFQIPGIFPGHFGIALFHGGVQLPDTVPGSTYCLQMGYGATPETMWCHDSETSALTLYQLSLDANGIRTVGPGLPGLAYGTEAPQYYNGRLYYNHLGFVVDPVHRIQIAIFPYVGPDAGSFTIDPDAGLIYFSRPDDTNRYFWAFDANRFVPVAFADTTTYPNNQWIRKSLVRCGAGGLAGINLSGQLTLVPLKVIAPLVPVTPAAPVSGPEGIVRLAVPNQDLSHSPNLNKLYVSVPDYMPGLGNSILQLDPDTLIASDAHWVGSRPSTMAVTQDGLHLYQELDGSNILRRIDLKTFTPDFDTLLSGIDGYPMQAVSMAPLPQSPDSVVVVRNDATAVYDHGNPRPNVVPDGPFPRVGVLDENGSTLYRLSVDTTLPEFDRLGVTPQGVFPLPGSLSPAKDGLYWVDMKCASGTCVIGTGIVIDAIDNKVLGTCPIQGYGSPLLDLADKRAYFLIANDKDVRIVGCSLDTFSLASQFILPAQPQFSGDLLLIKDRFLFNTGNEVILVPKQALGLPPPQISAVVNAASYATDGFAPLSIVTIFGSNFASSVAQATSFPLSTSLGGVSASAQGAACFPLYVSPNQINLVLSSSLLGNATLQISVGAATATAHIYIKPAAPGIFTIKGNHAVAQNQDYTTNSASSPAASGSVVVVYFTGQGNNWMSADKPAPSDPPVGATAAVTAATIGGQPATVLYSGATPGLSGVAQANIRVPNLPPGDHPLVLTVGGSTSNTALISVK